ncbi:MAG: NB-ARC domain-containing protein [Cyanobacteria bacterium J06600_6]
MKRSIDFERVLSLVDQAISPTYLNPTQEIVLREVWNGKTYTKMAYDYNYDPEYIKTVGCNLWQTLSRAFDEQINKSNFVPFMRQRVSSLKESGSNQTACRQNEQFCSWTTAPNVKNFYGRQKELATLSSWSQDGDCRLIVVSGMTGSGKTTLVTKFASSIKEQFDYVIWFSLSQRPSLTELLNKYLSIINQEQIADSKPQELSFLLSEFINCLREHKVLLVLDGLQCILEFSQSSVSYRQEFEGYGQFLRSVISTNHQSLLVTTSRIKPKLLEYYASNQVRFLDLQGFDKQATISFLGADVESPMAEEELLQLSGRLQHNPQLLKIANNHLEVFSEDDPERVVEDLSLLEAIGNLLEQELSYLAPLEREIVCWLAISCNPVSVDDLSRQIEHSQSKLKFSHSLKSLIERSLVIKKNNNFVLMPIMKLYLRRRLVKQAI